MLVIPAIDLRGGRCVRLVQGRADRETVYSTDPLAVARNWEAGGARLLHVVDLDGAFEGRPRNLEIVAAVARELTIPVQMGGGIRSMAGIEAVLEAGVERVILGTVAAEQPELVREAVQAFGSRVLVGVDAKDEQVAVRGWVAGSGHLAVDFAKQMRDYGVEEIIYTDIRRDGMMQGPNLDGLQRMAAVGVKVIASGGVSSLADLQAIAALAAGGAPISGAIVGKALYSGAFTLPEAIQAVAGEANSSCRCGA